MLRSMPFLTVGLLLAGCSVQDEAVSTGQAVAADAGAEATLLMADGRQIGTATVREEAAGVRVQVVARGLQPGSVHGLHVHTVGRCDAPDFASAGGHWNPTAMKHGRDGAGGPHMGDLPNLTVGADGNGMLDFTIAAAQLRSGAQPMLDADGASIVLHAGPDDYRTDPAGNSGGRIACGVVQPLR